MPTASQLKSVVRSTAGTPSAALAAAPNAPANSCCRQIADTASACAVDGRRVSQSVCFEWCRRRYAGTCRRESAPEARYRSA